MNPSNRLNVIAGCFTFVARQPNAQKILALVAFLPMSSQCQIHLIR
jgi:hypothetical protein